MEIIIRKISMTAPTWFKMFVVTVWNLLSIEPFFIENIFKTKIENYIQLWGHSWYCWKALAKFDLITMIS